MDEAPKTKTVNDWLRRPYREFAEAEKRRNELWQALNKFVIQHGAWIVSPPGEKRVRIEVRENSALPTRLAELGYRLNYVGTGTRPVFGGTTETITDSKQTIRKADGFVETQLIEITLRG